MAAGVLALVFRGLLPPESVERYYSRGLFPAIRRGFDAITGWMPMALVYPLFFILLFLLARAGVRFFKNKGSWKRKLLGAVSSLFAFAGGVVFFFLFLWGYNYGRIPLETNLGIGPTPLTFEELRDELEISTAEALRLRSQLPGVGDSVVSETFFPADLENTMRRELAQNLQHFGYPTPGRVRGRLLYPKGILLRISTAGVYVPFTGEGHIDAGMHYLQLPFVVVHEMSHGYGFGDEGTCNFLAYLACTQSENAFLRYVGALYYWRYVAADYRDMDPEGYLEFRENLPQGIKSDLLAIRQAIEKYPDILPALRDAAYSAYLQAQGIKEGLKNYDRVIMMVRAWRQVEN